MNIMKNQISFFKNKSELSAVWQAGVLLTFFLIVGCCSDAAAISIKLPLKEIMAVENIRLEGINANTDTYDFKLSIPERWEVHQALLTFSYSNSSALLKDRSRLTFSFKNTPLRQIPLDPLSPKGTSTVSIPSRLLTTGYHSFGFTVAQHSVENECEDPNAPELWTWVELADATIQFDIDLKSVPPILSAVNEFLFDSRNPSPPPVNLLFSDLEAQVISDKTPMKAVSLAASGVALRYGYRPVRFLSQNKVVPDADNIIIGTDAFIHSILDGYPLLNENLDEKSAIRIHGPTLMVISLPMAVKNEKEKERQGNADNSEGKVDVATDFQHVLLLTGRSLDEVETAAGAFSTLSLPLPDTQQVQIQDIKLPDVAPYTLTNTLEPTRMYTFSSLGFKSHTFRGTNPIPKGFSFRLPSDSHLSPNSQAILTLNIAYGVSMREDSVLNILLNGKFVAGIPCKEINGGTYRDYKVELSLSSMNAGYNKLTIAPQLVPMMTDRCTLIHTGNLRVTVFENSTFTIPAVEQWIEMPHLGAFMSDAFPFGKYADMRESLVWVPDGRKQSFLSAVNLVAIAAQKTGYPPLGLEWQAVPLQNQDMDRDIIMVSQPENVPEDFQKAAPFNVTTPGPVSYPHLTRPKGYEPTQGKGIWSKLIPGTGSSVVDISLRQSELVVTHFDPVLIQGRAALMQFQSPYHHHRTVMLLTASTTEDMRKAASALWRSAVQAACKGDTAMINLKDDQFETLSLKIGPSYYLGGITPLPFIEYYANTYPLYLIGGVLTACLLLSFLFYRLLKIRRKKRISHADTDQ